MAKPAPDCHDTDTDTDTAAARLAREHDARTLAAALLARLRADGRGTLAATLAAVFGEGGIIDPIPRKPEGDLILTSPPNPHRAGQE
jgi:hypothetical protein